MLTELINLGGEHHYLFDLTEKDFQDVTAMMQERSVTEFPTIWDWAIEFKSYQYEQYCLSEQKLNAIPLGYPEWHAIQSAKRNAQIETLLLLFHLNGHVDNLQIESPSIIVQENVINAKSIKIKKKA